MARDTAFDENLVLERARDLFWERGYTATSIQELEAATGIRRSSLYNTFGGKRALYDRTLSRYQHDNIGRLRTMLSATDDVRGTLLSLFTDTARTADPECLANTRGCYIVNATTELANSCTEALSFVSDNRQKFVALLRDALAGAQVRGELDRQADPEQLADFLFVCYNGLQVVVQTQIDRDRLVASLTHAVDSLPWRGSAT